MDGRKNRGYYCSNAAGKCVWVTNMCKRSTFFTSGRTTQGNCLTIVFYEYGELNIEYREK